MAQRDAGIGTYRADHDKMRLIWLIAPCAVLALIWNLKFSPWEIIWAFSIFLESVAILPQVCSAVSN